MPGVAEHQLDRGSTGLRNMQVVVGGRHDIANIVASVLPAVAARTILAKGARIVPRTISLQVIADATVATRTVTIAVVGRDQFGAAQTDTITVVVTASATVTTEGTKVFGWIDAINCTAATNVVAADRMTVGTIHPAPAAAAIQAVKWGLQRKVFEKADILGGYGLEAGVMVELIHSAAASAANGFDFDQGQSAVSFHENVGLDSTNDRVVVLNLRTSW